MKKKEEEFVEICGGDTFVKPDISEDGQKADSGS